MPVVVETDREIYKYVKPHVILPDNFHFMPDLSGDQPAMVGIYCFPNDAGQAVVRFTEQITFLKGKLFFDVVEGDSLEGVVEESLEEDTVYYADFEDEQGMMYQIASYHLGGLAAFYAAKPN